MKQVNNDRQFRMGYIQKSRQESGNQNIGGPRSLHFWKKASCQAFQKSKPKLQLRKLRRTTLKPINQKFTFPKWRHITRVRFARWLVPHTKSHSMGFGRLTHFLCLELEVSKFRCLMCSCILDMKNRFRKQKTRLAITCVTVLTFVLPQCHMSSVCFHLRFYRIAFQLNPKEIKLGGKER